MAKVVFSTETQKLGKDEVRVTFPTFLDEAKAAHSKASGGKTTSINHLRHMILNVAEKYDTDAYNAYTKIPLSNYEGIPFSNDEDLGKLMLRMFNKHYPALIDKAIEAQIKNCPKSTKTIYFDGPKEYVGLFTKNGIAVTEEE